MIRSKEELEKRKKELEDEKYLVEQELKHVNLPQLMREKMELGFGWPKLTQELGLRNLLDKGVYDKLYSGVMLIVEDIVKMVPPFENSPKDCKKCKEVKDILLK